MNTYNLRNEIVNSRIIAEKLKCSLISSLVLKRCAEYCLELMDSHEQLFKNINTTKFHIKETLKKEISTACETPIDHSDFETAFDEAKSAFLSDINAVEVFLK
jgi:hypothetical protein